MPAVFTGMLFCEHERRGNEACFLIEDCVA